MVDDEYPPEDFEVSHLGNAGVRITHKPTGEYRESTRHVVLSMNSDAAMDELLMELKTRPDP